ncbi:MAG: single-stranded DNA-binding protein [Micropruina sp.]|uniref:single-stranded DNA-binding protein n=1 Tax=Micropruina sp. TaxID=2737536 RepID=UPI0039E33A79
MDATITVTGNVGSDIDVRTDDTNEWAYAAFRLACTPRFVRNGTWRDGETTWLNVNCRNRMLSLNVQASVNKGDPLIVTGRLSTWSWTNSETGEIRERLVLEAIAVGHDLSRGTTAFRKTERPAQQPPVDDPGVFKDLEDSGGPDVPAGGVQGEPAAA